MAKAVKIAPSILAADFGNLCWHCHQAEDAGADLFHVDVMDGHFVPNITIGPPVVASLKQCTQLPLDVHLMIENPGKYLDVFAKSGASWLSFHVEACSDAGPLIERIKSHSGVRAGLALNPTTPIEKISSFLRDLDFVLLMSVSPGFGGQPFMKESLGRIRELKSFIEKEKLPVQIEVDGGISNQNASQVVQAGADVLVAGSAVFTNPDVAEAIRSLRQATSL